jgi:NADH:ubiquinone oxidoreductase subunit K
MAQEYASLIKDVLVDETAVLSEFRQRALSVVTTSGALVTLLTGLIAIAVGSNSDREIEGSSVLFLVLAIAGFLVAAGLALWVNVPKDTKRARVDELRKLTSEKWRDSSTRATLDVTNLNIDVLESIRSVNDRHAKFLAFAIGSELAGVFFLGLVSVSLAT